MMERKVRGACEGLILDFDGTMFRLFVNYDLPALSVRLHDALGELGVAFDQALDPFEVFGVVAATGSESVRSAALRLADHMVEQAEIEALGTGVSFGHCAEVLRELLCEGLPMAVSTNNSVACVRRWLRRHVDDVADGLCVFGREALSPEHLKPNPWTVLRAAEALGADPRACLYVGDTIRDFEAARACGCTFVGMAHSPEKRQRLHGFLRDEDIVSDYRELKLKLCDMDMRS